MPMNGPKALSATNAIADEHHDDRAGAARMVGHAFLQTELRRGTNDVADRRGEEPKSPQSSTLTEIAMQPPHLLAVLATERLRIQTQEMAVEIHQARFGAGVNAARPRRTSEASRSSSAVAAAAPEAVKR